MLRLVPLALALAFLVGCSSTSADQVRETDAVPLPSVSTTTLLPDSAAALQGRDGGSLNGAVQSLITHAIWSTRGKDDEKHVSHSTVSVGSDQVEGIQCLVREGTDHSNGAVTRTAIALGANDIVYERLLPDGEWQPVMPADLTVGRSWTAGWSDEQVSAEMVFTVVSRSATAPDGRSDLIRISGAVTHWRVRLPWVTVDAFDTVTEQWIDPGVGSWAFESSTTLDGESLFGEALPHRLTVSVAVDPEAPTGSG